MRTASADCGLTIQHLTGPSLRAVRRFVGDLFAAATRGLESVTKASLLDRARRQAIDAARTEGGGEISSYTTRIRRLP